MKSLRTFHARLSAAVHNEQRPEALGQRSRLLNRELSWLEFNERVLEEARDSENPLLERLSFLSITSSNLDEFYMIRVASLKDLINARYREPDPSGMRPVAQLDAISARAQTMVKRQYSTYNRGLLPQLTRNGIRILDPEALSPAQRDYLDHYFQDVLFPVLTPLGVDAGRPFPLIANQTLNIFVRLLPPLEEDAAAIHERGEYAIVQVPAVLPRLIELPATEDKGFDFILQEQVIMLHLERLFTGAKIRDAACFRITRNADLEFDEEEAADLLKEIESQLRQRRWGEVIRLEIAHDAAPEILAVLISELHLTEQAIFQIKGPIDLKFLSKVAGLVDRPDLMYPPFKPQVVPAIYGQDDVFAAIREQDVVLHHPYERFDGVSRLIRQAADDPDVLAIKQTLYRVSGDSPIVAALAAAATQGKQVLVLVELKARFDEENNINWARRLERAGAHVIYGLVGLKTHSKITLIVRQEDDGIRRYIHLGTGNYNDITARIYTDLSVITASESFGRDATDFFNMISGYAMPVHWRKLVPAPNWLRNETLHLIEREIRHAELGRDAMIIAKVNSLVDPEIIETLYRASQSGVHIELIVRGICCLRPGIAGLSERIRVRSIVGRFLEHARIFYYLNDGLEDLYLSSADWMPRNLDRRIELMFPVEDEEARARIFRVLEVQLLDTERSRIMQPDGLYHRVDRRGKETLDCQIALCNDAIDASRGFYLAPDARDRYTPRENQDSGLDD